MRRRLQTNCGKRRTISYTNVVATCSVTDVVTISPSLQADASAANVYGVLGECVLALGDAERGLKMIKEALKHRPENHMRLKKAMEVVDQQMDAKEKGNVLFKARDHSAAADAYSEGLGSTAGCSNHDHPHLKEYTYQAYYQRDHS